MIKLLLSVVISSCFFALSSCSTTPKPPAKKNLSTQPHNRPASWEGTGGLGSVMGQQYQD